MTLSLKIRFVLCFLLLLAGFLVTVFCRAQAETFEHVVFVVQENRTPDNLFAYIAPAGADVVCSGNPIPLASTGDLDHSHAAFLADQAGNWQQGSDSCVQASDVAPYQQIAATYGWSNRFFQTNQGPSFPAHQFLFGGSSQLSQDMNSWFAAENASPITTVGCAFPNSRVWAIDQNGVESSVWPCFERVTLSDELAAAGLSWRYYTPNLNGIWTAPNAIEHICKPTHSNLPQCKSPEWLNVITPQTQVLNDIAANNLANLSWVIPSGECSDHSGSNTGCGPIWVAEIVNAIGQSSYWQNTLILIVWDDWGGWRDHVAPPVNNSGWCAEYCYGFRVPMLAVCSTCSAYTSNAQMDFGSLLAFVADNFGVARLPYPILGEFDHGFFGARRGRKFHRIRIGRELTRQEFEDRGDPDDD